MNYTGNLEDTTMYELFWTATGNRFASGFATEAAAIAWGMLSAGSGHGIRWAARPAATPTTKVVEG